MGCDDISGLRLICSHGGDILIALHTRTGRNEFADDDVFFQADQRVDTIVDSGFCKDFCSLLE